MPIHGVWFKRSEDAHETLWHKNGPIPSLLLFKIELNIWLCVKSIHWRQTLEKSPNITDANKTTTYKVNCKEADKIVDKRKQRTIYLRTSDDGHRLAIEKTTQTCSSGGPWNWQFKWFLESFLMSLRSFISRNVSVFTAFLPNCAIVVKIAQVMMSELGNLQK